MHKIDFIMIFTRHKPFKRDIKLPMLLRILKYNFIKKTFVGCFYYIYLYVYTLEIVKSRKWGRQKK